MTMDEDDYSYTDLYTVIERSMAFMDNVKVKHIQHSTLDCQRHDELQGKVNVQEGRLLFSQHKSTSWNQQDVAYNTVNNSEKKKQTNIKADGIKAKVLGKDPTSTLPKGIIIQDTRKSLVRDDERKGNQSESKRDNLNRSPRRQKPFVVPPGTVSPKSERSSHNREDEWKQVTPNLRHGYQSIQKSIVKRNNSSRQSSSPDYTTNPCPMDLRQQQKQQQQQQQRLEEQEMEKRRKLSLQSTEPTKIRQHPQQLKSRSLSPIPVIIIPTVRQCLDKKTQVSKHPRTFHSYNESQSPIVRPRQRNSTTSMIPSSSLVGNNSTVQKYNSYYHGQEEKGQKLKSDHLERLFKLDLT